MTMYHHEPGQYDMFKADSGAARFKVRYPAEDGQGFLSLISKTRPKKVLYDVNIGPAFIVLTIKTGTMQRETRALLPAPIGTEFTEFWLTWYGSAIRLGLGDNPEPLVSYRDGGLAEYDIGYIKFYLKTLAMPVEWEFESSPVILKAPKEKIFEDDLQWKELVIGQGHPYGNFMCKLPDDAMIAGFENEPIYIAREYLMQSLIIGKYVPSKSAAFLPWGENEHMVRSCEILCGVNAKWVKTRGNYIPENAVVGGYSEVRREPLYIGRAMHDDCLLVGKVHPLYSACYLPYRGKELCVSDYEILVRPNVKCRGKLIRETINPGVSYANRMLNRIESLRRYQQALRLRPRGRVELEALARAAQRPQRVRYAGNIGQAQDAQYRGVGAVVALGYMAPRAQPMPQMPLVEQQAALQRAQAAARGAPGAAQAALQEDQAVAQGALARVQAALQGEAVAQGALAVAQAALQRAQAAARGAPGAAQAALQEDQAAAQGALAGAQAALQGEAAAQGALAVAQAALQGEAEAQGALAGAQAALQGEAAAQGALAGAQAALQGEVAAQGALAGVQAALQGEAAAQGALAGAQAALQIDQAAAQRPEGAQALRDQLRDQEAQFAQALQQIPYESRRAYLQEWRSRAVRRRATWELEAAVARNQRRYPRGQDLPQGLRVPEDLPFIARYLRRSQRGQGMQQDLRVPQDGLVPPQRDLGMPQEEQRQPAPQEALGVAALPQAGLVVHQANYVLPPTVRLRIAMPHPQAAVALQQWGVAGVPLLPVGVPLEGVRVAEQPQAHGNQVEVIPPPVADMAVPAAVPNPPVRDEAYWGYVRDWFQGANRPNEYMPPPPPPPPPQPPL